MNEIIKKCSKVGYSKLFLALMVSISFIGCKNTKNERPSLEVNSRPIEKVDSVVAVHHSDNGMIELKNGYGMVTLHKDKDQTVYVQFTNTGYKKLHAEIHSEDSSVNIRFSQIFLPDATMDGPFGRELDYDLPADGLYKLSIHENMMAGDPWSGTITVEVHLSK